VIRGALERLWAAIATRRPSPDAHAGEPARASGSPPPPPGPGSGGCVEEQSPPRPCERRPDPMLAALLFEAMRYPPEELSQLYAPATLELLAAAALTVTELAAEAGERGRLLRVLASERGWRLADAHRLAIHRLLAAAEALERRVRSLAWALAAPRPWPLRVRILEAADLEAAWAADPVRAGAALATPIPRRVWWAENTRPPEGLAGWARVHGVSLHVDARAGVTPEPGVVLVDVNPAIVSRPGNHGGSRIELSGAAAVVQCLLRGPVREGWTLVSPPAGLQALECDLSLTELRALPALGLTATAHAGDGGRALWVRAPGLRNFEVRTVVTPTGGPSTS
jgi:hypothetical protein